MIYYTFENSCPCWPWYGISQSTIPMHFTVYTWNIHRTQIIQEKSPNFDIWNLKSNVLTNKRYYYRYIIFLNSWPKNIIPQSMSEFFFNLIFYFKWWTLYIWIPRIVTFRKYEVAVFGQYLWGFKKLPKVTHNGHKDKVKKQHIYIIINY